MIELEEDKHELEIDNIFGRELLELEDYIDESDLIEKSKYIYTSLTLKSHNTSNTLLLEVDLEKINNILNKLISIYK